MKTKHTPGPWIVAKRNPLKVMNPSSVMFVADCDANGGGPARDEMCRANAKLIAAAPELLSILARILYAHDSRGNGAAMGEASLCPAYAEQARATILKATGDQA